MFNEDEIHIRLAEAGMAFVYSIVRDGAPVKTAVVHPIEEEGEDFAASGYYGGSQVMD
jgi:hypothetical protein